MHKIARKRRLGLIAVNNCRTKVAIGILKYPAHVDVDLDVAPKVAIYLVSYLRREYAEGKRHGPGLVRRMRLLYFIGEWVNMVREVR